MFAWVRQLFRDPNGDGHAAVAQLQEERKRSSTVKTDMDGVVLKLKTSREAVRAKVDKIREATDSGEFNAQPQESSAG